MQRTSGLIVVFLVILLASSYVSLVDSHGLAKKQQPAYRPGEVLIKYKQDTPPAVIEKRHTEWGVRTMRAFRHPRIKHLTLPPGMSVEDAIQLFSKDPGVEYVEPNYIWRRCATVPDDTRFSYLWGLNNTGQSVNGTAGTGDGRRGYRCAGSLGHDTGRCHGHRGCSRHRRGLPSPGSVRQCF
jgi:hypothetical protein